MNFAAQWQDVVLTVNFLAEDGGVVWSDAISPWEKSSLYLSSRGREESRTFVPYFLTPERMTIASNVLLSPRFGYADRSRSSDSAFYPGNAPFPYDYYGHSDTILQNMTTILAPEELRKITQVRFHFDIGKPLENQ